MNFKDTDDSWGGEVVWGGVVMQNSDVFVG